jgi:predicted membrane-bound mannosyltransferase
MVAGGIGAALVVVVLVGMVAPAVQAAYVEPVSRDQSPMGAFGPDLEDRTLVQYAQPAGDMKPLLREMTASAATNDGVDVVVYGNKLVDGDTNVPRKPSCVKWFETLPLPWYFEKGEMNVNCANSTDQLATTLDEEPVAVIVRRSESNDVRQRLPDGYSEETYELRLWGSETTFFMRR